MEVRDQQPHEEAKAQAASPGREGWDEVLWLPCKLSVELQIPGLKVGDLLALDDGTVIDTLQSDNTPLPVWVNGVMIGWGEFDVVGTRLAIRMTELR